jgi:transcriptional regulator with XRE-family HTH domain
MRRHKYLKLGDYLQRKLGKFKQKSIADTCHISQVAVSNWFNGYTRPELKTLVDHLIPEYGLDIDEVAFLGEYPRDKIVESYASQTIPLEDLEFLRSQYEYILQERKQGDPQRAVNAINFTNDWVSAKVKRSYSSMLFPEFRRLQGLLLYEQRIAFHEYSASDESILGFTKQVTNQMDAIAGDCPNDVFSGLIELCWGDTHYMLGQSRAAIPRLEQALPLFKEVKNINYQMDTLRSLSLSYAYLGEKSQVIRLSKSIWRLYQGGKWTDEDLVCQTLEGLGRSLGLIGSDASHDVFEAAKKLGIVAPIRRIQLVRSELIVSQLLGTLSKTSFEKVGRDALELAGNKWPRHAEQIRNLLNKWL